MDTQDASREVAREHRELEALFQEAHQALQGADREAAGLALDELQDALEAHFEREDALYYPTVGSLRPEKKRALQELTAAHERFREQMSELKERLRGQDGEAARAAFQALLTAFAEHETQEERLLASL